MAKKTGAAPVERVAVNMKWPVEVRDKVRRYARQRGLTMTHVVLQLIAEGVSDE